MAKIVPTLPDARGLATGSYVDAEEFPTRSEVAEQVSEATLGQLHDVALTGDLTLDGEPLRPERGRASELLRPAAALRETLDRANGGTITNVSGPTSGTLLMSAIALLAGDEIDTITIHTGSTAATSPTHWWVGLFDAARNMVAVSANQTTRAMPANTPLDTPVVASGGGAYVVPADGLYYVGILVAATGVPSLMGCNAQAAGIIGLAPKLAGNSDPGLTAPPAFPFTAASIATGAIRPYAYVS